MSYITPNTDIRILQDIPLDTSYEHTIHFENASDQATYFIARTKYTFSNQTYQRVQRGYVRVERNAEDLYDCNYLMFRNHAFGTKWFYAFITGVEYVSNDVSQINFQLDVIQSWMFDFSFRYAFIERQHTPTDEIGEHYEPEPVQAGEYILNDYAGIDSLNEKAVIVSVLKPDTQTHEPDGNIYEGVYSGTTLYIFFDDLPTVPVYKQVDEFLAQFHNTAENVVGIYVVPKIFVNGWTQTHPHAITGNQHCYYDTLTFTGVSDTDSLDGYTPRNKKLYCYPYNFFHVDNGAGSELSLRYEFFDNGTPTMEINGSYLEPVQALLIPKNYKGLNGSIPYFPESIPLTDFPQCSWSFDSYTQWKNTQGVAKAIRFVGKLTPNVVAGTSNFLRGYTGQGISNLSNMAYDTVDYLADRFASEHIASLSADICKGSTSNGSINNARGRHTYYYGRCSVNRLSAEMIDTFFDKYGYAINKVASPNLKARPIWTYIKTRDCTIEGSVPAPDMKLICNIFNKGITYWRSGAQVGRYDLAPQNIAPPPTAE